MSRVRTSLYVNALDFRRIAASGLILRSLAGPNYPRRWLRLHRSRYSARSPIRISHVHPTSTSPGYNSPQSLIDDLAEARETLAAVGRYRVGERLPIGVGYLAWKLDQDETAARKMLDAALDAGVQAIWLSFGASLGRWVEYVRARDSAGSKTLVFILVNSVEEALAAANELRADVLVAQGTFLTGGPSYE